MEGSNYKGYGYKTRYSYPRSRLITWRRLEVKFGLNVVWKKTPKLPRWGQKYAIKKKNNSQIKKHHLKRIPNKNNYKFGTDLTMED